MFGLSGEACTRNPQYSSWSAKSRFRLTRLISVRSEVQLLPGPLRNKQTPQAVTLTGLFRPGTAVPFLSCLERDVHKGFVEIISGKLVVKRLPVTFGSRGVEAVRPGRARLSDVPGTVFPGPFLSRLYGGDMPQTHATQENSLAAVVREMEERVDAEFGDGAFQELGWSWPAVFLRRPETMEADLECLSERLVRCGRWKIRD